jgi:hypothetical protein
VSVLDVVVLSRQLGFGVASINQSMLHLQHCCCSAWSAISAFVLVKVATESLMLWPHHAHTLQLELHSTTQPADCLTCVVPQMQVWGMN